MEAKEEGAGKACEERAEGLLEPEVYRGASSLRQREDLCGRIQALGVVFRAGRSELDKILLLAWEKLASIDSARALMADV